MPDRPVLIVKKGREKSVRNRHPWLFSGAIAAVEGEPDAGELVTVRRGDGRFLATATYHPQSQIRARILSWQEDEPINDAFWTGKIKRAIAARQLLHLPERTDAYRLIFSEADGLPGLIVDRYGEFLVLQALTAGIERQKEQLTSLLAAQCRPRGILERSDADVRMREGLTGIKSLLWGELPPPELTIMENGVAYGVDLWEGHKTGFYCDQRDNRQIVGDRQWVEGKTVLNLFSYTGGFGLVAAGNGARRVIHVDSSIPALEQAERNAALNGWERPLDEYIAADVFDLLRFYRDEGEKFDLIILDPPKFAHSRGDVKRASRGYKDLNWLAMRLLRPGGLLATFSCSGAIDADLLQKILFGAAVDAGREVQIIQPLSQGADHPVLLTFPESNYLDGFFLRVW